MTVTRRLVSALALGLAAVLTVTVLQAGAPASAATAPALQVQANRLVDTRTGEPFVPHGVNVPGLEYSCWQGWRRLPASGELAAIASWKINTIRLPLNQDCWLGVGGSPVGRTAAQYQADVRTWVDAATTAGLAVVLDLHSSAPAGFQAHGQRAMPDSQSVTFWSSVATAYKSSPSVIFDLFNEPYSRSAAGFTLTWDCWRDGGCLAPVEDDYTASTGTTTYPVVGMQALVTAVRAAGAAQPLMLGGLNYSNDLSGWLAHAPIDPLGQLVASWHNYPGQGCSATACWNSQILPVAASVPVVTGEFGNTAETTSTVVGNSGNFLVPFMTWADEHGVGYLPWAWWDVSTADSPGNGTYALYTGAGFTPKSPSGTKLHDYLAGLGTSGPQPNRGGDDYSGDGPNDVIARAPDGALWMYRGNGLSGWSGATVIGSGWNGMTALLAPGDFSGDGNPDVIARDGVGRLWLYRGNGSGGWLGATVIGSGWDGLTAIVAPGDFSGDGHPDLLARTRAGALALYRGDGSGGWLGATVVGSGWDGLTAITTPGDFDGDGFVDVLGRDGSGRLVLYRGNGMGGWLGWSVVGAGWGGMTSITSVGDFSGDGHSDVMARDPAGQLWLYRGSGVGGWLSPSVIGSGWGPMTITG